MKPRWLVLFALSCASLAQNGAAIYQQHCAMCPAIAGGIVYVYSGYGQWGGIPGNALLAFSVDGR